MPNFLIISILGCSVMFNAKSVRMHNLEIDKYFKKHFKIQDASLK